MMGQSRATRLTAGGIGGGRTSVWRAVAVWAAALACGPAWSASEHAEAAEYKPAYQSPVVTRRTPGNRVAVRVDVRGARHLVLVAADAGDGFSCDWANWLSPKLVGRDVEQSLTEMPWKSATAGFGQVRRNRNCDNGALRVKGEVFAEGIGTHANSVIVYELPDDHQFTHFVAEAGLDDGGAERGPANACSDAASVRFAVYTAELPDNFLLALGQGVADDGRFDPAEAAGKLTVHDQLQLELFASEPMMLSPSNIDIDHLGRVWVCEIVNYRGHNGKRPEGDRILVLEDTNQDGAADKSTVFYQGRDIDSPHGICVLGSPSGTTTRAIVSANGKVQVFTDHDGDLRADEQQVLFSGISGAQHDHGIHAFVVGPDGKLYFNFGNEGKQLRGADGEPIVDLAGNEVAARRQPYQEGMVFRCNLDGSALETLGWNFRNNWEVTIDSFGTLWQSDNDDDGNRGVRINFVMEYGNYGFKDEKTGAGWREERTGMHQEIPLRHWHLNDPGVVPNLLQTGAGSPTGICVYEGDLLPKQFHGQLLHCDAGPNVCRAYLVQPAGAGYTAQIENIVTGDREKWFRPSDVGVAPDGSVLVADWFDPGVGGHQMQDLQRGRIFRVTPAGHDGYEVPRYDYGTAAGAVAALGNPNYAVRFVALEAIREMGLEAEDALRRLWDGSDPVLRARALWALGKLPGRGETYVDLAVRDEDARIRIVGLRLARQLNIATAERLAQLVKDPAVAVRRECLVALRGRTGADAARLWAELATQYNGQDRWYLEALGLAADGHWDDCFAAWLAKVGDPLESAAGRDIVWRSRAKASPALLVAMIKDENTAEDERPRYFRALDFLDGPEKEEALQSLLLP